MMEVRFKFLFFLFLLFGIFFGITENVLADLSEVQYPVLELGGCNSQSECKSYCDDVENIGVCLDYAEKNNLMSKINIEEARKVLPFLEEGTSPGSCKTKELCENYCDLNENFDECLEFAHDTEIISSEVYEIAKITKGIGPGGCLRDECESFCSSPENFKTCLDFVGDKGLVGVVVSSEDYDLSKKMIPLIEESKMPGECSSERSCNEYCENKNNLDECNNFVDDLFSKKITGNVVEENLDGFEHEKSLDDFEGKVQESETEDENLKNPVDENFGDNNLEKKKDEKLIQTISKNKISRDGGSSRFTNSPSEEIVENEDSEIEIAEPDSSLEDLEGDIGLVDEIIFTEPEDISEEKQGSLEEKKTEVSENHDSEISENHDSKSQDSEDSKTPEIKGDNGDKSDSEDSQWTINSRAIAPLRESMPQESLFDFFKKVLGIFIK